MSVTEYDGTGIICRLWGGKLYKKYDSAYQSIRVTLEGQEEKGVEKEKEEKKKGEKEKKEKNERRGDEEGQ